MLFDLLKLWWFQDDAHAQIAIIHAAHYLDDKGLRDMQDYLAALEENRKPKPHWETIKDDDGEMICVRWSQPDADGRYWWCAHYPATVWGINAAERQADRWNREGKRPEEWREFCNRGETR